MKKYRFKIGVLSDNGFFAHINFNKPVFGTVLFVYPERIKSLTKQW